MFFFLCLLLKGCIQARGSSGRVHPLTSNPSTAQKLNKLINRLYPQMLSPTMYVNIHFLTLFYVLGNIYHLNFC
jgi:hypothetical protein